MANGSINFEAYTTAIYDALLAYGDDDRLFAAVEKLFPDLSEREMRTLKWFIAPAANKRMNELERTLGRAVPFGGGYPGATNGLDSLRIRLGVEDPNKVVSLSAFNSVPTLQDHVLRDSFLNAATYEIPGAPAGQTLTRENVTTKHLDALASIVAFFTVPSMGVDPEAAEEKIPVARDVMRFVNDLKGQPFPGAVNDTYATQGATLYEDQCASCHGDYKRVDGAWTLTSFPNYVGDIGSDRLRIDLFTEETAKAINASLLGKYINAETSTGYSAPTLTGVWATAPYLHNGSVPTLWHLFNPSERPARFRVGGHRLNFEMVGIDGHLDETGTWDYPPGYAPWADTAVIDTSKPGLSNKGHEETFAGLSDEEKRVLLEFLKTL
jgi:hypothetical protein